MPITTATRPLARSYPSIDPRKMPATYCMTAEGDCMHPMIESGAKLRFDRDEPARAGDIVALFFRPEGLWPGCPPILVKRLVHDLPDGVTFPWRDPLEAARPTTILVEMLNPHHLFRIPSEDILGIHLCLGLVPSEEKTFLVDHRECLWEAQP